MGTFAYTAWLAGYGTNKVLDLFWNLGKCSMSDEDENCITMAFYFGEG